MNEKEFEEKINRIEADLWSVLNLHNPLSDAVLAVLGKIVDLKGEYIYLKQKKRLT